jgi:hypothetical protein
MLWTSETGVIEWLKPWQCASGQFAGPQCTNRPGFHSISRRVRHSRPGYRHAMPRKGREQSGNRELDIRRVNLATPIQKYRNHHERRQTTSLTIWTYSLSLVIYHLHRLALELQLSSNPWPRAFLPRGLFDPVAHRLAQ